MAPAGCVSAMLHLWRLVAEQLLELVSRHFHAGKGNGESGGDVAHDVVYLVVREHDAEFATVAFHLEPVRAKLRGKLRNLVVDLDQKTTAAFRESRNGGRAPQVPAVAGGGGATTRA